MNQTSRTTPSLRRVLIIPYVLLVLVLALSVGALSYVAGRDTVDALAKNHLLETVGRIGQAIDRHIVGSAAVLEAAFPDGMPAPEDIKNELPTLRTRFWIATSLHIDPNNYVYYGNRAGQAIGLWRYSLKDGELRIKTQAEQPRIFYRFKGINGAFGKGEPEAKIFDPRARPWYKAGETASTHTWTAVYIDFRTAELVATRARRVLDNKGKFEGVVATDVSLSALNDFVRDLHISPNGLAFVMEPDGNLIASSGSAYVKKTPEGGNARLPAAESGNPLVVRMAAEVRQALAAQIQPSLPQTRVFDGPEGQVYAAFDRVKDDAGLEWITVVAVPRGDFMHGVTGNLTRTVLLALLAAIAAVILGSAIIGWVSRDLRKLSEAARRVGEGDLDFPIDISRGDEIGVLARSFEQMKSGLRTDRLTGLLNRQTFTRHVSGEIARRRGKGERPLALLFIDLDGFKQINDTQGHDAGDRVLVEVAQRLLACVGPRDKVARYAGDEFVVLLDDASSGEEVAALRSRIEAALAHRLRVEGVRGDQKIVLGGSIGIALYPSDGDDAEALLKHADREMYACKFAARVS
ncbi:diguanylate cyclase [Niveibacterium sp. SC-1]|uniref:diguanylate cyclase domain-containing protein n=1 Tax=Niveibacterium sp. SC-1 TaxID=3135646 RepID=UPI00311E7ACF